MWIRGTSKSGEYAVDEKVCYRRNEHDEWATAHVARVHHGPQGEISSYELTHSAGTSHDEAAWLQCDEFMPATPGMCVSVTYRYDTLCHERLLLYPVHGHRWITLAPNGNYCEEDLSGYDLKGPRSCREATRWTTPQHYLQLNENHQEYHFSSYPRDAEMKELVHRALGFAAAITAREGLEFLVPCSFLQPSGNLQPFRIYLQDSYTKHRTSNPRELLTTSFKTRLEGRKQ
jgi:hypothetical protein